MLELTRALLEAVEAQDRQLSAHEAACILPCIVEKAGSNAVRRLADATLWCRICAAPCPGCRLLSVGSKSTVSAATAASPRTRESAE